MTKMAGYVRVSTPRQAEHGESLAIQEKRLRAEAKQRGWALTIYKEEGISAKDDKRPAYQRMLADLEAGTVAGVVATKLDRLWRSLRLAVNEIHAITETWDRSLVVLDTKYDTTTASGRFALNSFLIAGQFERDMTSDRVAEVMHDRAERGKWNGGVVPLGYVAEYVKDPATGQRKATGKLLIQTDQAKIVRQLFRLYLEKRSIRRVAHVLNADGIKAPLGGAWSNKTVRRLLKNRLYIGTLVYGKLSKRNGKLVRRPAAEQIAKDKAVPGIIPTETFLAVQKLLKAGPLLHPRAVNSDFLLTGLVRCGRCGGSMPGWAVRNAQGKRYRYYRCNNGVQKGATVCRGPVRIPAETLEKRVLEHLFDLRVNPAKLRAYMKEQQVRERSEVTPLKQRVGMLESKVRTVSDREDKIKLAYEEGAYDVKEMKRRLALLAADKEKMEKQLEATQGSLGSATLKTFDVEHIVQCLQTAFDLYEELPFEDQRSLLHNLLGEVRVGPKGGTFTVKDVADGLYQWTGASKKLALTGRTARGVGRSSGRPSP